MSRVVFAVVLVLTACSKPKPETTVQPQVSMCARVADHVVSLMSGAAKHPPEATDPFRRVVEERCDKDQWTVDAKQCLLDLTTLADGARCQGMMTPAQVEAFQRDSEAATADLRGQLGEEPAAGSAAPADAGVAD
jgi:hypothetical protein